MQLVMIPRPRYLEMLRLLKDNRLIKIVTGVRRCGKSTIFQLFIEELKKQGVTEEQIQLIKLDEDEGDNPDLHNPHHLHQHIMQRIVPDKPNYVFLDEVQNVPEFEKAVRSLYEKSNIDLYLTGSNSRLQNGTLATALSGRSCEIKMYPLSFKEFIDFRPNPNLAAAYEEYLKMSSFPYIHQLAASMPEQFSLQIKLYLENIYNTVVIKDILNTGKVSNASRLRRLMAFMASSIGSEISVKKISDMMKAEGLTIRPQVVDDYLDAFINAYIWHKASRYDLRGRKMLSTKGKYYIVDLGLRNYLCPPRENDFGHILENVVYLELLRRGFTVYVGQIDHRVDGKSITKEVDFVAENQEHREYYQITYTMHHPETLARELAALKLIKDNHPKYILSTDAGSYNYDGIQQINVWNWLAERESWP